MTKVSVLLVYEPPGGNPLTIARVNESSIVSEVARIAIQHAESRAEALAEVDCVIGELEQAEVSRLRRVIGLLVSDCSNIDRSEPANSGIM
jgi:hypothetical protein